MIHQGATCVFPPKWSVSSQSSVGFPGSSEICVIKNKTEGAHLIKKLSLYHLIKRLLHLVHPIVLSTIGDCSITCFFSTPHHHKPHLSQPKHGLYFEKSSGHRLNGAQQASRVPPSFLRIAFWLGKRLDALLSKTQSSQARVVGVAQRQVTLTHKEAAYFAIADTNQRRRCCSNLSSLHCPGPSVVGVVQHDPVHLPRARGKVWNAKSTQGCLFQQIPDSSRWLIRRWLTSMYNSLDEFPQLHQWSGRNTCQNLSLVLAYLSSKQPP